MIDFAVDILTDCSNPLAMDGCTHGGIPEIDESEDDESWRENNFATCWSFFHRKWNKLWSWSLQKDIMYILFWESSARYKKLWEKRTRRNNSTYGKLEIVFSRVWALKHPPLAPILQRGQWSIKRDPHIAKNHDMKSSMSKMTSRSIRWDHNVKIVCTVEFTIYQQPLYETLQYKKFENFKL